VPWPAEEEIFPGLRAALERALRARPEERFASAEDFAEALEACLPKGKRVGRRRLSEFLAAAFSAEIEDRRQQARELRQKTESFLRKTRVAPPGEEETVSLVESVTDWDPASLPPAAQSAEPKPEPPPAVESFVHPMPPPLARVGRKWGLVAAVAALVLPLAWHYWPRSLQPALPQGTATGTAQVAAPLAPTPAPESRPTAALPESGAMSPVAPGPLIFRVEPATASLKATFPGGQRQGKGRLSLEGLPAATPVLAVASLAGYEPQSRSFASPSEPSPEEHVFRLEKKAAAFGSLRVNATPWGRVSMAGYIGGSETPVTRGRIPEGRYPVSVSNSALRKTLSATAVIRAGKTTQCHADFEGRAALSCR
jgi:hypothetical protein